MLSSVLKIVLCVFSVLFFPFFSLEATADDRLMFSIHPFLPPTELIETFDPLATYTNKESAGPIETEISDDYQHPPSALSLPGTAMMTACVKYFMRSPKWVYTSDRNIKI